MCGRQCGMHESQSRTIQDIKAALKLGATVDEIMDVFNLCVAQGITACNMGIPILDEKLAEHPAR
jgi:hypothetical protein